MSISIIYTMVGAGVVTAVGEIILNALGKTTEAQWVKIGGISFEITVGLGAIASAIGKARSTFGG